MAIGVQRITSLNPEIVKVAVVNDHLHSRGLLSDNAAIGKALKTLFSTMTDPRNQEPQPYSDPAG